MKKYIIASSIIGISILWAAAIVSYTPENKMELDSGAIVLGKVYREKTDFSIEIYSTKGDFDSRFISVSAASSNEAAAQVLSKFNNIIEEFNANIPYADKSDDKFLTLETAFQQTPLRVEINMSVTYFSKNIPTSFTLSGASTSEILYAESEKNMRLIYKDIAEKLAAAEQSYKQDHSFLY